MDHLRRIGALRRKLTRTGLPGLLVTHLPDVRYLCGFTGSNAALAVTRRSAHMFTDGRYTTQAAEEVQGAKVEIARAPAAMAAVQWLAAQAGVDSAGFDPDHTTVAELARLEEGLPARLRKRFLTGIAGALVEPLRLVKDEDELAVMREAALMGCRLFEHILGFCGRAFAEIEVAAELEHQARLLGAEGMSFETIVASGLRSAMPHGRATTAPLPRRGFVTLDFGIIHKGYCSDMTRTVYLGTPKARRAQCIRGGAGGAGGRGGCCVIGRELRVMWTRPRAACCAGRDWRRHFPTPPGTASALRFTRLRGAGWAVAMHLWFLAVYLAVVSLTPIAIAAQRRCGLLVPVVLMLGVVAVDAATLGAHVPYLGWLNYLICWGAFYQLGIAWHGGLLAGRRPLLIAAASAATLTLLIWLGHYPVSMIGVPGQTVDNTTPPNAALLAFGCAQNGIVMALAPALNRALRGGVVRRVLSVTNSNVMALYLWHMIPVVIVAIVGYPAGLLPQPAEGTAAWWLARLQWVAILCLVTAFEMVLLWWGRRVFGAPLPTLGIPLAEHWVEPVMLAGAAMAAYGLAFLAAQGFAPDGHYPLIAALVFSVGAVLVALRPKVLDHAVSSE